MNIKKYNCVICHIPFDDTIHLPRILNKCNHTICSLCISKKLFSNKNSTFSCPKDNTIYSKIDNIDYFEIDKEILEKIKESKNDTSTNNNINLNESSKFDNILSEKISNHTKTTKTKIDTITINDNSIINNTLLSMQNNHQCYIKKIIKFGKKLKFSKNSQICSIHSLPLNIICVDDLQKICSQCALNNIHLNHQIILENKFMEYINELVKVYQEIENNINIYADVNNINTELILEKIEKKINKIKNNVVKICEDLIENINVQCKQISKFLDLRKNELFNKYQFTNCDINNLRETTNNWVEMTCTKLTQASSGNYDELNIESLKLLDIDKNKNIFSLIDSGKQLNERYNFISETREIIDKLNEFNKKGLDIEPNYNIIDSILIKTTVNEGRKETKIYNNYNYNESIINTKGNNISTLENNNGNKSMINFNQNTNLIETSLFKLEENKDVADSLNLTPLSFLYKQTKNIFITYENDELDNFNDPDPYNTVNNINFFSPKFKQYNTNKNLNIYKMNTVYSKKTINSARDYDSKKNEYYINFKNDRMSKTKNNFYHSSNHINIINLNENNSRQNRLALSGNIRYKTQYDIREKNLNISQTFKRMLYPKLEKVKTCDVVFLGSKKRKKSKESFILTDGNSLNLNKKYYHQKTVHKFPLSPKLKSVYNIISKNMKMKDIYSQTKDYKRDNKASKNNLNKKYKDKDNKITDNKSFQDKDKDKIHKNRYIRCVSCSSSLNKKDIQDISILFNLKENENIITDNKDQKIKTIKDKHKDKVKTKDLDVDKESDISDITINNNNSQNSHHLNKSCIKKNRKTYYNFRNSKNVSKTKSITSPFIKKSLDELTKYINSQMEKNIPVFNRINMREKGINLLCNYLEKNKKKKYKAMKLSGCNLNDESFCLLGKSLIDNEIEISVLNLSYNKISDNSAKIIFEIIKKNIALKNIYLNNNIFSKNFIEKLGNYKKDKDFDFVKIYT